MEMTERMESFKDEEYMKWTQREINWYLAEDRLLFGSDKEVEIHKWDLVFQQLINITQ